MNRTAIAVLACCLLPLSAGCGAHEDDTPADVASTTDAAKAYKPIPYVVQFVGTYTRTDKHGEIAKLTLTRTGSYTLTTVHGEVEHGEWRGPSKITSPVAFVFLTSGHSWKGSITGYNGPLVVDRGNGKETLSSPIPADLESLCGDTGGEWRDDDGNPTTGLYCDCPKADPYWLPGYGGCVSH